MVRADTSSRAARRTLLAWLLLLLPAIVIYAPGLSYPFLGLDDVHHIAENPAIKDLSWSGIRYLFLEDTRDLRYFPMSYLSLAIDYHLFGLDVFYFHLTNLLLHLANTLLVMALIWKLFRDEAIAGLTGLLFSIHPLQVESVAWVISRKNVLFMFFFLSSALVYGIALGRLHARRRGGLAVLGASALLYLVACLSKTAAISLPAALLLIDHALEPGPWPGWRSFLRRNLPTKAPHLVAAVAVVVASSLRSAPNPFRTEYGFTLWEWILLLGHNLFFYLAKTLVPLRLGVFYPVPEAGALPGHFLVFALASVGLLALVAWSARRGWRILFFGLAWYVVTIAPLAIFTAVFSDLPILVADRYYYQSALGLCLVPSAAAVAVWRRRAALRPGVAALVVLSVLTLCSLASAHRSAWRSTIALYESLLANHPTDEFYYRLALAYADAGRPQDAFGALDAARAAPTRVFFMNFLYYRLRLAELELRRGDVAAAAAQVEAGIESTPNAFEPRSARTPLAYAFLAELRDRAGDPTAAARARATASTLRPDTEHAFELPWIQSMPREAGRFLEARTAADPNDGMAWYYRALHAQVVGDERASRELLERAARLSYRP